MMKKIPLTHGKFTIVDDHDYEWLNRWKWNSYRCQNGEYRARRSYWQIGRVKKVILMSRQILGLTNGDKRIGDHINHIPLDNRRCNLRICTRSQNLANQLKQPNKTSRYKGVSWYVRYKKWVVKITCNHRIVHGGYFENEVEAAKAYDKKALELFGEFALLNFPKKKRRKVS